MDKLRAMEVFVMVVERGSLSAAAEHLAISAVMVGKLVKQLEDHLACRLLHRTTRRQNLTEAGAGFYEHCKAILQQVHQAESSVDSLQQAPQGLLRISAPITYGSHLIAPLLARYLTEYPQVKAELILSNHRVDLIEEAIDLAIRIGPIVDESLVARALPSYKMVVCAAPTYLAQYGTPQTPADLSQHRCLSHLIWRYGNQPTYLGQNHEWLWPQSGQFSSNDGNALREAALQGAGLILQPEILLTKDLQAGHLVPVLEDFLPPARSVHLLYLADSRPRIKLHSLIDFVLAKAGQR